MSQIHRLQQQRFELKYLITEEVARRLRNYVSSYLELDDYAVGRPNLSYPVHSIYFDSDDFQFCHASINGNRNRFKLRLRYYDENPETPVFCEIKGRADNCILKRRCGLRRDAVASLAAGRMPQKEQVLSPEPRHWATLQEFCRRLHLFRARPKLHNSYLREAWVCPRGNDIRITFDRNILVEPCFQPHPVLRMRQPIRLANNEIVLEVKFTERFPDWFNAMVQRFDLVRSAFSKYTTGVLTIGENRFHRTPAASRPNQHFAMTSACLVESEE